MKKKASEQGSVNIDSISNISGSQINVAGGNLRIENQTLQTSGKGSELVQKFEEIYRQIEGKKLDKDDRDDLKNEVKDIQQENDKGERAEESFLTRRLRNIRRMAPDIFEVMVVTLTSPIAGVSAIARKVAEKMKAEAKA